MDLGKKIRIAREERGLNQAELASKLKITSRTLQNYEYGTSIPDIKIVQEMAKIFKIQISYFLDEKFDVSTNDSDDVSTIKDDVSSVASVENVSQNKKMSPNDQNPVSQSEKMKKLDEIASGNKNKIINLRLFDNVNASAGYGANGEEMDFTLVPVTARFLTDVLKVPAKQYDVVNVFGDSMEPLVKNGDKVLVERDIEARNGDIVIANLCGEVYVKKILINRLNNEIRLTSLNAFYPDIVVSDGDMDQLKIIGRVRNKFIGGGVSI